MALNKFETEVKNKLNLREIHPSAQAWDRLDAMLSIAEKPKKKFPWLLIAASFIGFMFVGTMIYRSNNVFSITDETPSSTVTSSEVDMQNPNIQTPNVVVSSSEVEIQNQNLKNSSTIVTSNAVEMQNKTILVSKRNHEIVDIISKKSIIKNQSKEGVSITNQNQIAVNQKQQIVNQTSINQEVLSKNTDEILAMVKPKVTSKTSLNVNPASLLSQVDGEITTEFRENVFTKVSKNFQTVKVALADRNNTK
jgi:hypothetical protein